MLRDVLDVIRGAGDAPLSAYAVARQLGLSPGVAQHMLDQLVQRGRVEQVSQACRGCDVCPLHRFCAGAVRADVDLSHAHGYRIRKIDNHS